MTLCIASHDWRFAGVVAIMCEPERCYEHRSGSDHITGDSSDMAKRTLSYDGPIVTRSEAMAAGLHRYFTGKPCPHGHLAERYTQKSACCACMREKGARRHAEDPNWGRRLAEKLDAKTPEWRERERAWRKEYRQKNLPKVLQDLANWRRENAEKIRSYSRQYRIDHRAECLAAIRNRKAKKLAAPGSHSASDLQRIYRAQKGKCAYCRKALLGKYHVDHIQALARGGTNDARNLQITCASCNLRKHAKPSEVFARQLGLLI